MADSLVTYDPTNRELRTVPEAFAARDLGVLSVVWRSDVDPGAQVEPGTELADIQWQDNSRGVLTAPDGCAGQISTVNRNIAFENLPFPPSQVLLRLS